MPHPQRYRPPVPTGSSREKPTFFHRQSFMFNASSGRKELLCTERERDLEYSRYRRDPRREGVAIASYAHAIEARDPIRAADPFV